MKLTKERIKMPVNVGLVGGFIELYKRYKPKGMNDQDYVNAIISSWLLKKEDELN